MPPGLRMALRSGARLGPYEIVSAIGAGRSAAWRMPWTPGRPPRRARQRRRQSRHPHAVRSPRKAPIGGHAYARLFQGLAGDAGMSLHPGHPPTAATDRNRCEQPAPERFCQAKERCNIASRFGLSYLSATLCLCAVEAITIMTKPKTDLLAWQSADGASRLFCGDSFEILPTLPDESVDCVWTDPPYLLSNDGITCVAGKMMKVNKGEGDRSRGVDLDHEFSVNLSSHSSTRRRMKRWPGPPDSTVGSTRVRTTWWCRSSSIICRRREGPLLPASCRLSSRGCLCPSYGEGSGHPCDRSCCPEHKRASGQARGPLAVVRSTGHWGGAPALYWFFFQVSSTVTGIWFSIRIVSREGGSILKSESVAGIVPVIRVSSPEVVTSNGTCL